MRLKSLELVGFKSFNDATSISFASGLTAVVGPNGCGKSNVVDAIRWVLGEQAPTRLRGKSIEDLIYIGNDQNPAAGMAEVSLILEAEDDNRLPEPYGALSEVAVTRRVYRSGDSEYLLNKIPCRLKDISEFFMAAQIHSRGYSLVEQGKIEEIIQAKPQELRSMIEEAAGLSLFKGRREISERKLERVKENLSRLNDVLSEIERQLSYARRQAKKAEQYKTIKAELSELERLAAARRLIEHRETLVLESARGADLSSACDSARAGVAEAEQALSAALSDAQALRAELSGAQRELDNLHAGAAERERTREFMTRRLDAIAIAEPQLRTRIADLEARSTLARAARAAAGARLARETAQGEGGAEARLSAMAAELEIAQRECMAAERRAEDLKDEVSEIIREAAVIRGRLGDLAGERAELEARIAEADANAPARESESALAKELLAAAEADLEAGRAEITALESAVREAAEREIEARAAAEHLSKQIASLRETIAAAGQSARTQAADADRRLNVVLESMNGDGPAMAPAWLRDVLRAPAEISRALGAVLGAELDAVVVDSPAFALRAIEILKQTGSGRLSFVQEPDAPVAEHPAIGAPGIAGRLLDMIEVDARFRPLAEAMLGNVMLADDLGAALRASSMNGHGTLFVTREGDVLNPGRVIVGGSTNENIAYPAGDNNRHDAARELVQAEEQHRIAAECLSAARAAREGSDRALADARARGNQRDKTAVERRAAAVRVEQQGAIASQHSANSRGRIEDIAALILQANSRLEQIAFTESEARIRLASIRDEVDTRRAATEKLGAAVIESRAMLEARKAELSAIEREFAHAREAASEVEAQIREHRESLDRSEAERLEFERELEKLTAQEAAAGARQAELMLAVERITADCAHRDGETERLRSRLGAAQEKLRSIEGEITECNLRRERASTMCEELARSFREKFDADFDSVAPQIVPALAGRDGAADDARLSELRARAERIGEVNLAAEGEVRELEERSAALSRERADLEAALADLTQTITKLNREARRRFAETFQGAARNFDDLLPKLMRGSRGRLELTEASDVLEAGVTILVQPLGKKVKEIGLLSGGEKALSAMALIFSLFLLNPSPFCVMDEVDAPLDEFSLTRFTDLLSDLKTRSQFIVITHNQRTMQRADQIHGVTMDRPGSSKVISLKIPQAA